MRFQFPWKLSRIFPPTSTCFFSFPSPSYFLVVFLFLESAGCAIQSQLYKARLTASASPVSERWAVNQLKPIFSRLWMSSSLCVCLASLSGATQPAVDWAINSQLECARLSKAAVFQNTVLNKYGIKKKIMDCYYYAGLLSTYLSAWIEKADVWPIRPSGQMISLAGFPSHIPGTNERRERKSRWEEENYR